MKYILILAIILLTACGPVEAPEQETVDIPVQAEVPDEPEVPEEPMQPDEPEVPEEPQPDEPEVPEEPDVPEQMDPDVSAKAPEEYAALCTHDIPLTAEHVTTSKGRAQLDFYQLSDGSYVGPYWKWNDVAMTEIGSFRCYNSHGEKDGPAIDWESDGTLENEY